MMHSKGLQEAPRSWLLVPPDQSMSGHVEVLVSVRDTILSVDELDSVDQVSLQGPVVEILRLNTQIAAIASVWPADLSPHSECPRMGSFLLSLPRVCRSGWCPRTSVGTFRRSISVR